MNYEYLPDGKHVDCYAVIRSTEVKVDKNGNDYLIATVGDNTSSISAKMWKYNEAPVKDFKAGDFVKIRGVKDIYNGEDQLKIEKMRRVDPEMDPDVNITDFVPSACLPGEVMMAEIEQVVHAFSDDDFKQVVFAILAKYRDRLIYWPAAKMMHHSVNGGLLMHTLSMLRIAQAVAGVYSFVNYDLLCAGVILHDVCKIEEIGSNSIGLAGDYTVKGNLIGHLVLGAMEIDRVGRELGLDEEKMMLLEHMLISHHGVPEFGAAKYPGFVEAQILSSLDDMDAKVYEINELMNKVEPGKDTRTNGTLDFRTIYNHGLQNEGGVELM